MRSVLRVSGSQRAAILAMLAFASGTGVAAGAQVMTIDTSRGMGPVIDRRYAQIEPTKINIPSTPLDARGHQDLLRTLTAEQGFAMRPLPRGKKGLTLAANGKLSPAGEGYLNQITEAGLSVKPGDRAILSNVRIEKDHIVFDINGGPERKHEFLRHIEIGAGPMTNPVVQDDGQEPTGSRITLAFSKFIPNVTPEQVKSLLAPLISFNVKTPVQAYTDTLPPRLKEAILNHHVMVGMNTEMVLYALGQPESKSREMEGQMPFEEWIYGHAPQDVQFVRVNGNRVIRVEVAKLGQPLEVFTRDEVEGLMLTNADGRPVMAQTAPHSTVQLGDVHRDPDRQAPAAPPSLRRDGEKLPSDDPSKNPALDREGPMRPVVFPKDTTHDPAHTVDAHGSSSDVGKPAASQPAAQPDVKQDSQLDSPPDSQKGPQKAGPSQQPSSGESPKVDVN